MHRDKRVDCGAAVSSLRQIHPALAADRFCSGGAVIWLHPDGREMAVSDCQDAAASVLCKLLEIGRNAALVWFN